MGTEAGVVKWNICFLETLDLERREATFGVEDDDGFGRGLNLGGSWKVARGLSDMPMSAVVLSVASCGVFLEGMLAF